MTSPSFPATMRPIIGGSAVRRRWPLLALAALAACASGPELPPPPTAPAPSPQVAPPALIQQTNARWVATDWSALPGWGSDAIGLAWPALLRSCAKPHPQWRSTCDQALQLGSQLDETQIRQWFQTHTRPYRVETLDGRTEGMMTGYYEPQLKASRTRQGAYTVPLYQPPADLATRKPWWTRAEMDTVPAAKAALAGREIAYVANPLDALFLQVQGSGRLLLHDAQGQLETVVRVVHGGTNGQPFKALSGWLVAQGALTADQANADAIKQWAATHPHRMKELINSNPRVAFFEERPLTDPSVGPPGTQGIPLTSGRSVAVDPDAIPLGTPVWVDSTDPQKWSATPTTPPRPLQRLMVAQDTGSAIKGAVRADYFWGWGEGADVLAGRTKQPLRLWTLWPVAAGGYVGTGPQAGASAAPPSGP